MSGAEGSNECPAGSVRIETEAECRAAAAATGKTAASAFVQTYSFNPRGCCYYTSGNNAYFNAHAVGAGNSNYRLLCATTGALRATDAHSSRALSGTVCVCVRACVSVCVRACVCVRVSVREHVRVRVRRARLALAALDWFWSSMLACGSCPLSV